MLNLILMLILILKTVSARCQENEAGFNKCVQESKSSLDLCQKQDLNCQCSAASTGITCFSICSSDDEELMKEKYHLVQKVQSMCNTVFKPTPTTKLENGNNYNKLKLQDNNANPTPVVDGIVKGRPQYFNIKEFPVASDPPNMFNHVSKFQTVNPEQTQPAATSDTTKLRFSLLFVISITLVGIFMIR